jgi:hypothetical protein
MAIYPKTTTSNQYYLQEQQPAGIYFAGTKDKKGFWPL